MANKVTFINVDYGSVWDARYNDEMPDENDWAYVAEELVGSLIKVTLSTNTRGDGFSVTLTDKQEKSKNKGLILNNWGSSFGKCLSRLAFFVSEATRLDVSWLELHESFTKHQAEDMKKFKEFIEFQRKNGQL
jgi:hypothetical protein